MVRGYIHIRYRLSELVEHMPLNGERSRQRDADIVANFTVRELQPRCSSLTQVVGRLRLTVILPQMQCPSA